MWRPSHQPMAPQIDALPHPSMVLIDFLHYTNSVSRN
jgi:hypothetical protein